MILVQFWFFFESTISEQFRDIAADVGPAT